MKRKIMAVLLSAALVMSSAVPVFAIDDPGNVYSDGNTHNLDDSDECVGAEGEGTVVNVAGDVDINNKDDQVWSPGVSATSGGEVNVGGEVSVTGLNTAVGADGQGSEINIEENVTNNTSGEAYGVQVNSGATVNIGGDVTATGEGVATYGGGTVNVDGSVTGGVNAIMLEGGNVTVGNDVNGSIGLYNGSSVTVGGDVTGTNNQIAIQELGGNNTVKVVGNVTSTDAGIKTSGGSKIIIEGTLTAANSKPIIVFDHSMEVVTPADPTDPNSFPTPEPVNNPDATASTILVHEIKGDLQNLVKSGYTNSDFDFIEDTDDTLKNSQLNNIFYIIKKAADSVANILGLSGTQTKEGYDVAKAGTALTVTVKEGYGLTAGDITVTKNADGTYTLTVPQGGGVTLTAEQIQEAVQEAEQQEQQPAAQPEQPAAQPEQPAAQPEQPAAQPEQPAAQPEQPAAPVGEDKKEEEHQSSSSAQDQSALWPTAGTVVLAGYDEATALDPTSDPAAYVSVFVDKIANTPQGGTAELFVTDAAYLDDTIVQALVARSDVAVKLNVTVNGQALVINIPAGYNLSRLIGKDGKISMKKLIELFVQKK